MNTSHNSKNKRKKAIPLHFQKSHTSLSQILQTGSYKRRVKDLLKNNKTLALALQDARFKAASQEKRLEEYSKSNTQVMRAKLKLKNMVSSIQKLVVDLDDVMTCLDVRPFNLMQNNGSNELRLRIQEPQESTIEESASTSALEVNITATEDLTENNTTDTNQEAISVPSHTSPGGKDNSVTEFYDLQTTLAKMNSALEGCLNKPQTDETAKKDISDGQNASISIQSPPTPQLGASSFRKYMPPEELEAILKRHKLYPRKPFKALNSLPVTRFASTTFVSKIPKVQAAPPLTLNVDRESTQLPSNTGNRRETFIIEKPCNIPDIIINPADRRGTFTVNCLPQNNQHHNDRRETYLVRPDVGLTIPEELQSTHNLVETPPPAEISNSNKTLLLCEDMELTEIVPTRCLISNEPIETELAIPTPQNTEHTICFGSGEDMEFTAVIPVSKLLSNEKDMPKDVSTNSAATVAGKKKSPIQKISVPSVESYDACFVKPNDPKQTDVLLPAILSHHTFEEKQIQESADKITNVKDGDTSNMSLVKRKHITNEQTIVAEKEILIERRSSMSRKKTPVPKKSGRFSDVKGTHQINLPRVSFKNSVDYIDKELPENNLSDSSSSCKRQTRSKSSLRYDKFFENESFNSEHEHSDANFVPSGQINNFSKARKSLVPNKRTFVFTNTTKKLESESAILTDNTSKLSQVNPNEEQDVFNFSTSSDADSISNATNKPKKSKKPSKRSNQAVKTQSKKGSLSKRPRSEEVPRLQIEKQADQKICKDNKTILTSPKKLSSSSKSNKSSSNSSSPVTTDESFIIGEIVTKDNAVKELVNLKSDQVFSEVCKPKLRNCKDSNSTVLNKEVSLSPKKDILNTEPNVASNDVNDPKSSSPFFIQSKEAKLSPKKSVRIKKSNLASNEDYDPSPPSLSKADEEKRKTKRPFSGVSERKSKKRSTSNAPNFLDEFDNVILSQKTAPKTTWSNDRPLDCEMTVIYNVKDVVNVKIPDGDSGNKQHMAEENQNKHSKNLTKANLSNSETLSSSSNANNKTKSTLKDSDEEKIVEVKKLGGMQNVKANDILSDAETLASCVVNNKSKNILKDSNKEQVTAETQKKHDGSSTNELGSKQRIKSKVLLCDIETLVPSVSTENKKTLKSKDSAPIFNKADFENIHLDDLMNNDFVPSKPKKLISRKDTQCKIDNICAEKELVKSKPKKPRQKNSSLAKLNTPVLTESQNLKPGNVGESNDGFSAVVLDSVPIYRQNCSGSIDSICTIDSKDSISRQSRRTRPAKSYKEPALNMKMRR